MRTPISIDALFPKTRQAILAATFLDPPFERLEPWLRADAKSENV